MLPTSSFTRVSFATSTPRSSPIQIASVVLNATTLGAVPSLNFSERAAGVFFLCAGGGDVANEVCGNCRVLHTRGRAGDREHRAESGSDGKFGNGVP